MAAAGMHTWTDALANVHGLAAAAGKCRSTRGGSAVCWALVLCQRPACSALQCCCLVVPARPALHHRCPLNRPPHHPIPADPATPHILVGSHYDTVHDGGKFDGALGIIAGIAAAKALLLEVGPLVLAARLPSSSSRARHHSLLAIAVWDRCASRHITAASAAAAAALDTQPKRCMSVHTLPPCRLPWQRGLSALLHCKRQQLLQARASHSICPGCCLPEVAMSSSCLPHLCMWWRFQTRRASGGQRRRHARKLSCHMAGWCCQHASVTPGQLAAADQACVLLQISEHLPGQPRSGWQSGPRCVETPPFWSCRDLPGSVNADTLQCAPGTACTEACGRWWSSWQQPCPLIALWAHWPPFRYRPCLCSPSIGMLEAADAEGVTVRQALEQAGFHPSPAALRGAAVPREQVCGRWQAPMYKRRWSTACARPLLLLGFAGMPATPTHTHSSAYLACTFL